MLISCGCWLVLKSGNSPKWPNASKYFHRLPCALRVPGIDTNQLRAPFTSNLVSHRAGWPTEHSFAPVLDEIAWGTAHDRRDAYLASWVASLPENDRSAIGRPPADAIWVPRLPGACFWPGPLSESMSVSTSPAPHNQAPKASPGDAPLVCPACGKHSFKRWPLGWDAHAHMYARD